jgi:broad specificity phosphatase PhoE
MVDGARVLLVRHGAHDWLLPDQNRFAGRLPVPLNATGRAQAQALARRLQAAPPDRIRTSPIARARETAEIVADSVGCPAEPDARLTETGLGPWEGMAAAEVRRRYPEAWVTWRTAPTRMTLEGFEPVATLAERMLACACEALAQAGTTVLVSHQDPLLALVCRLLDLPLEAMRRLDIAPASLTVFEVARGRPVLVMLNSATSETR